MPGSNARILCSILKGRGAGGITGTWDLDKNTSLDESLENAVP